MKFQLPHVAVLWATVCSAEATTVYSNSFTSAADLSGFTTFGEVFTLYSPPPLHAVSVDTGQLRIDTSYNQPNFPSTTPTLMGRANLMLDTSTFGNGYNPTLSQSSGLVSWSFNLSNQDGAFNNIFDVILVSSNINPYDGGAGFGYEFWGGGGVGNRMFLGRFSNGESTHVPIIDITSGLAPLPTKGSFRITYDPQNETWSLFGTSSSAYVDPTTVNTLLGSVVDNTWTHSNTPYLGLVGGTTGSNFFDNLTVAVVPEPTTGSLLLAGLAVGFMTRRGRRSRPLERSS